MLVLEAKREGTAASSLLNTLDLLSLLTCDCDLGWQRAETVHIKTLFNHVVSLTLTVSFQTHLNVLPTVWGKFDSSPVQIFVKVMEPSAIFVQNILRQTEKSSLAFYGTFYFQREAITRLEVNLIKPDILYVVRRIYLKTSEARQRTGPEQKHVLMKSRIHNISTVQLFSRRHESCIRPCFCPCTHL